MNSVDVLAFAWTEFVYSTRVFSGPLKDRLSLPRFFYCTDGSNMQIIRLSCINKLNNHFMKRLLSLILVLVFGITASAKVKPIDERPQDVITYSYNLRSNNSVSTTIFGLEYSYEGKVADRWTLIGRAGLVPCNFSVSSSPRSTSIYHELGLGLAFEGRYYSNIAKRAECGRSTYNNSSDFVSMRLRANTTARGLEVSFTPSYGLRRTFGKLWFHEATFGPKIGIDGRGPFVSPHIQYRIGLSF